ncbi:MAG TPA: hypothetical protein VLI65_08730, partial [Pyrinomonadaceae bacterium]|nr:hypothetical protein [Pyrinomonadaceae bacterium]
MKTDEYLWDKTGSDTEIERLEGALAAFRYKASDAPALPVESNLAKAYRAWSIPRFAFASAMAASFALLLVSIGLWMQPSTITTERRPELAASVQPAIDIAVPKAPATMPAKAVTTKRQTVKRSFTTWKRGTPTIQNNTTARLVERGKTSPVKLSKEELYAYNQLMLALEITG